MTGPEQIHRITRIEERLLAAHDALSAVLDDDEALREVTVDTFDLQYPDRKRPMHREIESANADVRRALEAVRARLSKLGAIK